MCSLQRLDFAPCTVDGLTQVPQQTQEPAIHLTLKTDRAAFQISQMSAGGVAIVDGAIEPVQGAVALVAQYWPGAPAG